MILFYLPCHCYMVISLSDGLVTRGYCDRDMPLRR
jgi:hypothetical protein